MGSLNVAVVAQHVKRLAINSLAVDRISGPKREAIGARMSAKVAVSGERAAAMYQNQGMAT